MNLNGKSRWAGRNVKLDFLIHELFERCSIFLSYRCSVQNLPKRVLEEAFLRRETSFAAAIIFIMQDVFINKLEMDRILLPSKEECLKRIIDEHWGKNVKVLFKNCSADESKQKVSQLNELA